MRMNISVPDDLARQVRERKLPVSQICQEALRQAVSGRRVTKHEEDPAAAPEWLSIGSPEGGGTHLRIARRGSSRWVVDGVYVHGPDLTASIMQRVPVSHVELVMNLGAMTDLEELKTVVKYFGFGYPIRPDFPELTLADLAKQAEGAPREFRMIETGADRPKLTRPDGTDPDGFYARVAVAYVEYAPQTRAPAVAIASEAEVPVATARSWVRESRRRGKLPPGRKGKAG